MIHELTGIKKNHTSPHRKGMDSFALRSIDPSKFVLEKPGVVKVMSPWKSHAIARAPASVNLSVRIDAG
jgi:hypothetical protein